MSKLTSKQLVESLIQKHSKQFPTTSQRLAYERGLLTGLLSTLAHNDTYVYNFLLHKLEKDTQRK